MIRRALCDRARYKMLLYIDGDSSVIGERFIQQYIDEVPQNQVVVGGRCYATTKPVDPHLRLHWKYGRKREQRNAFIRNRDPWAAFMTNNFMIPKILMQSIPLIKMEQDYGHEDTLMGWYFYSHQVDVLHIENPLEHLGLVNTMVFFEHATAAVDNLSSLYLHHPELKSFLQQKVKLVKAASRYSFFRRVPSITASLTKWITVHTRMLFFFDLYRLIRFCKKTNGQAGALRHPSLP